MVSRQDKDDTVDLQWQLWAAFFYSWLWKQYKLLIWSSHYRNIKCSQTSSSQSNHKHIKFFQYLLYILKVTNPSSLVLKKRWKQKLTNISLAFFVGIRTFSSLFYLLGLGTFTGMKGSSFDLKSHLLGPPHLRTQERWFLAEWVEVAEFQKSPRSELCCRLCTRAADSWGACHRLYSTQWGNDQGLSCSNLYSVCMFRK